MYDALVFGQERFAESQEFDLGLRELRRRIAPARWWFSLSGMPLPGPREFLEGTDAPQLLVIVNPAIVVCDRLVEKLLPLLEDDGALGCALPSDQRGFAAGVTLDYASRGGFDRFVRRLDDAPPRAAFDGRTPWIYLVARKAIEDLDPGKAISWEELPALLGPGCAIAQRAYVHSYHDYYSNARSDVLELLPAGVTSLLDVGGGEGGFAAAFMAQFGGRAVLLEQNPRAAAAARRKGLEVCETRFEAWNAAEEFDCISFLDVLEHLADPLAVLQQARSALKPGGCLLLSVPNVGHWSVVWDLLEGRFDYQPVGILCNTHVRFFSRHELRKLLDDAGFRVERWDDVTRPIPDTFRHFLDARAIPGVDIDFESLATESFHVIARHG